MQCVFVCVREREDVCVCLVCVCVKKRERGCVCVYSCVFVCEKEREDNGQRFN
jgi:hypothetical protein